MSITARAESSDLQAVPLVWALQLISSSIIWFHLCWNASMIPKAAFATTLANHCISIHHFQWLYNLFLFKYFIYINTSENIHNIKIHLKNTDSNFDLNHVRYNITKVARANILRYFNQIFDGLCKLFAHVDMDVKNGANQLDRLIKVTTLLAYYFL